MRIFFYGNCQAKSLHDAYVAHAVPLLGGVAGWAHSAAPLSPAHEAAIAAAEVVVVQAAQFTPRTDISAMIAPGARRIVVPVVGTPFLWPYCGTPHPESQARYGKYHPFTAEHADSWLLRRLRAGDGPEEAVRAYLAHDAARSAKVARRAEMELELLRERERGTGFAAADFVAGRMRGEKLFRTPYHMTLPMARFMALRFLDVLGVPDAVRARLEARMGDDYYIKSELPVHPTVAAAFGLAWAAPVTRYRFYMETLLTAAQFYARFAHCEAYPQVGQAHQAAIRGAADAAAQVDAAFALVPDSPWLCQARATLLLRAGNPGEALAWAQRARDSYPDLWMIQAQIADCLDALGRPAEAAAALRLEIARQPYSLRLYTALASRQERCGAFAEAAESLARAVDIEPGQADIEQWRARMVARAQQETPAAS